MVLPFLAPFLGAAAKAAGGALVGQLFASRQKPAVNLAAMRAQAEANGFNPLTVLGATGGAGFTGSSMPNLAASDIFATSLQDHEARQFEAAKMAALERAALSMAARPALGRVPGAGAFAAVPTAPDGQEASLPGLATYRMLGVDIVPSQTVSAASEVENIRGEMAGEAAGAAGLYMDLQENKGPILRRAWDNRAQIGTFLADNLTLQGQAAKFIRDQFGNMRAMPIPDEPAQDGRSGRGLPPHWPWAY